MGFSPMRDIRDFIYAKCLGALPWRYKRRLFVDLAKILEISKVTVKGEYGDISGFIDDSEIFKRYVREGVWSRNINAVFVDYFSGRTCGTFLDIGANIGLTTIPVARNRHIRCHAFEPDPDNFELLQENIRRNGGSNVQLHNVALFSDATSLMLALSPDNRGNHKVLHGTSKQSLLHSRERDRKTITVRGDRLDGILDTGRIEMPLAIKIDAEGSEYHIYQGGRSIIRLADLVVMEYWPNGIKNMEGSTDELIRMIAEDFDYAKIVDEDEPFGLHDLTRCSDIVGELKHLAERALEMEYVDVLLAKKML
jgi:FkbM family methyltransferase